MQTKAMIKINVKSPRNGIATHTEGTWMRRYKVGKTKSEEKQEDPGLTPAEDISFFRIAH